jgi:hypothetical protein
MSTLETTVAVHTNQLEAAEKRQDGFEESMKEFRADLAGLRTWIMGATLASCLGLLGVIAQLLVKR